MAGRPNLCGTPPNLYDNVHDGDGDGDGHIDGHALIAHMRALRTDPDWRVQLIAGPALWDIALIHWPTHTRLALRLAPDARERWRPVAPGCLTASMTGCHSDGLH